MTTTAELVDQGDLDELLRQVDRLCARREWDELVELRDRSRRAQERGHQLWPAASHAEYRLALEAPGRWAAAVLVPGAGRFALGPLAEVAASTHRWEELAPHAPATPEAALAAHERVLRGEDLSGDERVDPAVLELPLRLQPWEPAYPLALYRSHEADFGDVAVPRLDPVPLPPTPGRPVDDPESTRALVELARAWTTESNGRARAEVLEGDAPAALACLLGAGAPAEVGLAAVGPADALAAMAWTAASGGAHGRRPGMAAGRFSAWWAVCALVGGLDRWPLPPDEVGAAAGSLRWYRWQAGGPRTGWHLGLAVEDTRRCRAWALEATDVSTS